MSKSQTVISIRRDQVSKLRELNNSHPRFLKTFLEFHSVSNYPAYLSDAIFVSHSEHGNINTCHIITPFLGATFTNIIHKSFDLEDGKIFFHDKNKVIENFIMGYKGVFTVDNIDKLELQAEFAVSKNSFYSVFGFLDDDFENLTQKDFNDILDIVDFVEKDKIKEQEKIDSLSSNIHYMGAFAQRQACLAFQSNGLFKAYPFKSNKKIHLDVDEILEKFKKEAMSINHRFDFADEEKKELLILSYVSSYDFKEELSESLFEAFIAGLKGEAIKIPKPKSKNSEVEDTEEETEENDFND